MANPGLDHLFRLHKFDVAIAEVRRKAANLDAGQSAKAQYDQLKATLQSEKSVLESAEADRLDAELQEKSLRDKVKKIEDLLYGGTLVNPREIEAYQIEQKHAAEAADEAGLRAMNIAETLPPMQKNVKRLEIEANKLREQMKSLYEAAVIEKERLEGAFKQLKIDRAKAAAPVPKPLLDQYESIRAKVGGIGLSEITERGTCTRCGTQLPTKVIEHAKEDKIVTCESCRRILIWVLPKV